MPHISSHAKIGQNVRIAPTAIIHDNVIVGDGCDIQDFCILGTPTGGENAGKPLILHNNSIIRSHSILYEGSTFGENLHVAHSCVLRDGITAGSHLSVGNFSDLEGNCVIGDYCRFHSQTHIGRGCKIGNLVWIYPNVVLTNDPLPPSTLEIGVTVEDGCVICTGSVILPGAHLGKGSFVAALSRAKGAIPPVRIVAGFNGEITGTIDKLRHRASNKQHPWPNHFARYPDSAQPMIKALGEALAAELEKL